MIHGNPHAAVGLIIPNLLWPLIIIANANSIASTLKAKIAKLKSELINGPGGKSAGSKDAGRGFDVSKSGDTRIGLVGFPSVGKSTLLTQLTGTRSAVSEVEFTTLTWCVLVHSTGLARI